MTIATTEADRDYIRRAQAEGRMLVREGAVEILGGALALMRDEGMTYGADATECGCSAEKERAGHACGHMRAGRHAARHALCAGGGGRETAA